jgi:hypothetical protein
MLHDYETALANYRLITSDYKNESNMLGGINEAMALCLLFTNSSKQAIIKEFRNALENYISSNEMYFLIRAITFYSLSSQKKDYKEFIKLYEKIVQSFEKSPLLPIYFEQIALCHLKTDIPMIKKYSFFMIVTASKYFNQNLNEIGLNCYKISQPVYEGN